MIFFSRQVSWLSLGEKSRASGHAPPADFTRPCVGECRRRAFRPEEPARASREPLIYKPRRVPHPSTSPNDFRVFFFSKLAWTQKSLVGFRHFDSTRASPFPRAHQWLERRAHQLSLVDSIGPTRPRVCFCSRSNHKAIVVDFQVALLHQRSSSQQHRHALIQVPSEECICSPCPGCSEFRGTRRLTAVTDSVGLLNTTSVRLLLRDGHRGGPYRL